MMHQGIKWERYAAYASRGVVRALTMPARWLPESTVKQRVRTTVLRMQNSLPVELAVNRGDTAVQVGTPWPQTLCRFRRAVGSQGTVVVIEAHRPNFERLSDTVREYGYRNVHLIYGAAWSENKMGEISISAYHGDHKVHQDDVMMDNELWPGNANMPRREVRFYRLDDALSDLGIRELNFLSVTVNGAEFEVLKGAAETLKRSSNVRVYAKGHARLKDGAPLHTLTAPFVASIGYNVMITRGEPSATNDPSWKWRAGDLFAWKD